MGKHGECSQPNGQHRGARQDSGKALTGELIYTACVTYGFLKLNQNWNLCFIHLSYTYLHSTERKANWGMPVVASCYAFNFDQWNSLGSNTCEVEVLSWVSFQLWCLPPTLWDCTQVWAVWFCEDLSHKCVSVCHFSVCCAFPVVRLARSHALLEWE